MFIETLSQPLFQLRGTNSTDNGQTPPVTRIGPPSGLGDSASQATSPAIIQGGNGGNTVQNGLLIVPYGVGSNGNTFNLNVYSWRPIVVRSSQQQVIPASQQWVAVLLCQIACTLASGTAGVAGGTLGTSTYFCSTLSVTYGNANVSIEVVSTAAGRIASFTVDAKGSPLVEVWGDTGGSATNFNALYSWY